MLKINSLLDLKDQIAGKNKAFLLLHKSGSEQSDCAFEQVKEASAQVAEMLVMHADVNQVRDIHPQFNITSAPTLLEFELSQFKNVVKGCNNAGHYKALFENAVFFASDKKDEKPAKRVTVYSTPTCSWCTTLKTYLRQNKVHFSDIDVSRDQRAAEEMVRRSGQQGVPQTDINGEMIIGFNKSRIKELLDLKS